MIIVIVICFFRCFLYPLLDLCGLPHTCLIRVNSHITDATLLFFGYRTTEGPFIAQQKARYIKSIYCLVPIERCCETRSLKTRSW